MNWTTLNRTAEPPVEPVEVREVQASERIDADLVEDEEVLQGYIVAARMFVEGYTNRALVEQTWTMKLADWPCADGRRRIDLPKPPLLSVTSIAYVDTAGVTQTLAADQYSVHADAWGAYIVEAYGATWPSVRCQDDAITVVFLAGYAHTGTGDTLNYRANVPAILKTAVKRHARGQYEKLKPDDREALEQEIRNLLQLHRVAPLG